MLPLYHLFNSFIALSHLFRADGFRFTGFSITVSLLLNSLFGNLKYQCPMLQLQPAIPLHHPRNINVIEIQRALWVCPILTNKNMVFFSYAFVWLRQMAQSTLVSQSALRVS